MFSISIFFHSSVLLATTLSLVTPSSESHYWVTTSLSGCCAVSALFQVLPMGSNVSVNGGVIWLPVLTAIFMSVILTRWSYVLPLFWSIDFTIESLILYQVIDANGSGSLHTRARENIDITASISRLFFPSLVTIRYLQSWYIGSTNNATKKTSLLNEHEEANYGTSTRLSPIPQPLIPPRISLVVLQYAANIFPWFITLRRFLLHVWPESTVLQLAFLSRVLVVILQRIVSILVPYQTTKLMECLFRLHSNGECTFDSARHTLHNLILLYILETGFNALQGPLWSRIVQGSRRRLSNTSFRYIFLLEPYWHQRLSTSEKSSIIGKSRGPDKFIDEALFGILPALTEFAIAVGYAYQRVGFYYASMLALSSGCCILVTIWSAGHAAKLERAKDDAKHCIVDLRGDYVGAYQTLQVLQKEADAAEHHDIVLRNGHSLENKVIDWSSVVEVVQRVVHSFGLYILLSPTLPGIYSGMHSPVDIMALLAISLKLQKTSNALAECVRRSQSAAQGDKRRQDLALEKITVVDHTEASELLTCGGHIEFKDVGFSYRNNQLLRSVEFSCRSGEVVAFVGPSGAGKSTIFNLIFRDYIPQTGSIYIDGEDIQFLKGISLRRHVGLVRQNPELFNRSLIENLRLARDGITDEEIYSVAQDLGFHDAFQKVGYEIKVGDRGLSLSGGQRMMVAITMVVIKDPKIILLDEATAAFDPAIENIFQSAIKTLKGSKTMIMIAHRESTLRYVDKVFWLRDGELSGGVTHDAFLKEDKRYASFWEGDT